MPVPLCPVTRPGRRPRRGRRLAVGLAVAALLGSACSRGGGGSSESDVIATFTDPDLADPLDVDQAECVYRELQEAFGGDIGPLASASVLDDEEAEVVARVGEVVEFCRSGVGPRPAAADAAAADADADDDDE